MAVHGRGRGRGRKMMSFSVEALGINKGDSVPPSIQQPTPPFPAMENKPIPLTGGEEVDYLLALKQEFRGAMKSRPFFIQPASAQRDVERYSDKYHNNERPDSLLELNRDWKRLPNELRLPLKRTPKNSVSVVESKRVRSCQKITREKSEVLIRLNTLENKEAQQCSEESEEKEEEEEETEALEEYDEEEMEEETDYIMSYFDNGEDFGGDSDDNMDEAIY